MTMDELQPGQSAYITAEKVPCGIIFWIWD